MADFQNEFACDSRRVLTVFAIFLKSTAPTHFEIPLIRFMLLPWSKLRRQASETGKS